MRQDPLSKSRTCRQPEPHSTVGLLPVQKGAHPRVVLSSLKDNWQKDKGYGKFGLTKEMKDKASEKEERVSRILKKSKAVRV